MQRETNGQPSRPLSEQDRIDSALQFMATRIGRVLTAQRINLWHEDLAKYPVDGIEYAFECWSRNSKTLPSLADIAQILKTWHVENVTNQQWKASPEERTRFNKGYGENDIKWLWKERQKSKEPWSDADYESALLRLDKVRAALHLGGEHD